MKSFPEEFSIELLMFLAFFKKKQQPSYSKKKKKKKKEDVMRPSGDKTEKWTDTFILNYFRF